MYSLGIEEVLETVKTQLKDKHGGLKINVLILIQKYLEFLISNNNQHENDKYVAFFKEIVQVLIGMLEDGEVKVRE